MTINRADKAKLIDGLKESISRADAAFIAEYQGIKAVAMDEIRKGFRASSVELKVMRNTLARRAVAGTPAEPLTAGLKGPTALIFSYKDAAQAAKKLTEYARENPKLVIKGGVLGGKAVGLAEIKGLAELPPREVLLAKMLGTLKSPATGLVGVLSGVPRKLVYALDAIAKAKAAGAGA